MKHLKIVFMLTMVVLISSVAVFVVEGITTPIIDAENIRQANAAKFEVLPTLEATDDITPSTLYDFTGTSITELIIVSGKGYIYTAQFQGYSSTIKYIIGIDLNGVITGYKTLLQGDTPGLGAEIANPNFYDQFIGMTIEAAESGDIDGLSGATVTTLGLKGSLAKVTSFHKVNFMGVVIETEAEKIARWKKEITVANAIITDVTSDYTLSGNIIKVELANDGAADVNVIYTVEFTGYVETVEYLIAFDLTTNDITGFRVIYQNETPGYGAAIAMEDYWVQFDDLAQADALSGNIDAVAGVSGAPITMGAFKVSLNGVVLFHQANFEGTVIETEAQKIARWKQEITVSGAIITNVSSSYTLSNGITKIEMANNGSTDVNVIYTVEFQGYADVIEYLIAFDLTTNDVTGFRVIYQNDTPGLGAKIAEETYWIQFNDLDQLDALNGSIDGLAGATITTGALKASLNDVVRFHQKEFEGITNLTEQEKIEIIIYELFPLGTRYENVTRTKLAHHDIEAIYDVYNASNTYLGVVYYINTVGASYSETTYLKFLIGVNPLNKLTGFRMLDDNETPGKTALMYEELYQNSFIGDSVEVPLDIDSVAGSTITNDIIIATCNLITEYHLAEYLVRPDSIPTSNANLLPAFLTATTFTSVYEDYAYNTNIYNIYEARDSLNAVLGYVYFGHANGFGNVDILFTFGVNTSNMTTQITILNDTETWDEAAASEYSDYSGSAGLLFTTSPWLVNFESKLLSSIVDSPIDGVAGVSTTTNAMLDVLEFIANYHYDESVGGTS